MSNERSEKNEVEHAATGEIAHDASPGSPPVQTKIKKPINKKRLIIVTVLTIILSVIVYFKAMSIIRQNPDFVTLQAGKRYIEIQNCIQNPGSVAFAEKDHLLILCLGLDENRDEKGIGHTKGSRTDTMFILSLDKNAEKLGILSIPRDTYVKISEARGFDKLNSAYSEAFWEVYTRTNDYERAKQAGIMQARKTISDFLGVQIDYVVLLRIKACKELVDELSGITVDVEKDMDYDDSWGKLHIHLKKGRQRLNGEQAVGYARFRHDEEGDWGRIRRQQQVIQALVTELKKPTHITRINKLAGVLKRNLDTDLDITMLIDLANVYKSFNRDNIARGVVPGTDDWAGDAMILIPIESEKNLLVRKILRGPSDVMPEDIRVTIVNGSTVADAGTRVARQLKKEGYNVVEIIDSDPVYKEQKNTTIINHLATTKTALMLEKSLGVTAKFDYGPDSNIEKPSDFTIVVGDDFIYRPAGSRNPSDNGEQGNPGVEIEGFKVMVTSVPVVEQPEERGSEDGVTIVEPGPEDSASSTAETTSPQAQPATPGTQPAPSGTTATTIEEEHTEIIR